MKRLVLSGFVCLIFLSACASSKMLKEDADVSEAKQILQQTMNHLRGMKGFRWHVHLQRQVGNRKEWIQQELDISYLDPEFFHVEKKLSVASGPRQVSIYAQKPYLYIKNSQSKKWVRKVATTPLDYNLIIGMERRWADPVYVLSWVKQRNNLKIQEKQKALVVQLSLYEHDAIQPLMSFIEQNPQFNGQKSGKRPIYHAYQVEFVLDAQTYRLKRIKHIVSASIAFYEKTRHPLKETLVMDFKGLVDAIRIPTDALKTQ